MNGCDFHLLNKRLSLDNCCKYNTISAISMML